MWNAYTNNILKKSIDPDDLKSLIFKNVGFLKSALNLFLPQGHELVSRQNISKGFHEHEICSRFLDPPLL